MKFVVVKVVIFNIKILTINIASRAFPQKTWKKSSENAAKNHIVSPWI